MIKKITLKNFKIFRNITIDLTDKVNMVIGENGTGKSSLLWVISCVLNGSFSQIEKVGIESLFNVEIISEFFTYDEREKTIENLPNIEVEIFLYDIKDNNFEIHGKRNSIGNDNYGLKLLISPNEDYTKEIQEILRNGQEFPFEYYKVEFITFSGSTYNSYNKKHNIKHELIDTSLINTNYSIKKFVQRLYENQSDNATRQRINHEFRKQNNNFSRELYNKYNLIDESPFKVVIDSVKESTFKNSITAQKDNISLYNLGQGENIMLSVSTTMEGLSHPLNIVLIEEPENHLSYLNMKKLINIIENTSAEQLIISTHSNMIASRLGLKNIKLINGNDIMDFENLEDDTSLFFKKSPNNNLLNFILGKKVILVEGDAEFILLEEFYHIINNSYPFEDDVTIISCGGLSFKRYLEIGRILNKKVLVITDNDKNYKKNIEEKYAEYIGLERMHINADGNSDNYTFEVALFNTNEEYIQSTFETKRMSNGVQKYMLENKTEFAMKLLIELQTNKTEKFQIPEYIKDGIIWIKK